ncbi:MAG: RluA family pseudouridine synthase [Hespellia sp.]|nr:RluA family pseudouridine synthase [Hespellia sp.]
MVNMNPEILYEDKYIIVCVKPAGIATQSKKIGAQDMVSLIKNYLSMHSENSGEPYLAVIHRLDQPTSGILVFAKTREAARDLNRQLKKGGFGKYYLAELRSIPIPREGILEHYLIKDRTANLMRICDKDTPEAKLARLTYQVIKINDDSSCIAEIILETGRQHQIRAQMAAIHCPIAGDVKYGAPDPTHKILGLYAYKLTFRHPHSQNVLSFKWNPQKYFPVR